LFFFDLQEGHIYLDPSWRSIPHTGQVSLYFSFIEYMSYRTFVGGGGGGGSICW